MLRIELEKFVPHPFYEVLSQYYDYEHIEHVHPNSLGRYEMYEEAEHYFAYRQVWPGNRFGHPESIVRHYHEPPNKMRFEFVEGKHKGTVVHTTLHEADGGTLLLEAYEMNLPNWPWLKPLVTPFVRRSVDHIWDEDLAVEVCHDGWPGIPESMRPKKTDSGSDRADTEAFVEAPLDDFADSDRALVTLNGIEVAVFRIGDDFHAIENRCSHTGGPLHLGTIEKHCVACPWHGREFSLDTGRCKDSGTESLTVYRVERETGRVIVRSE